MLDSPLLDVSVRGFGEKMLGSPCRPLSSIFEDVTQTTSLQSTLFFRYVTDFSLSLFRQTKLISCLKVALRFNFCISRFLRQIKFTKLINICSLICLLSFTSRPISLLSDFLLLEIDRKSLCYFEK